MFAVPEGEVAKYFRFEDDPEYDYGGGFVFKDAKRGWLQIGKDKFNPELENYWIPSTYTEISTTNYAGDTISLYKKPFEKEVVTGYIRQESLLNVLECNKNWAYVKKGEDEGWLAPEHICTNPVTTCN